MTTYLHIDNQLEANAVSCRVILLLAATVPITIKAAHEVRMHAIPGQEAH